MKRRSLLKGILGLLPASILGSRIVEEEIKHIDVTPTLAQPVASSGYCYVVGATASYVVGAATGEVGDCQGFDYADEVVLDMPTVAADRWATELKKAEAWRKQVFGE